MPGCLVSRDYARSVKCDEIKINKYFVIPLTCRAVSDNERVMKQEQQAVTGDGNACRFNLRAWAENETNRRPKTRKAVLELFAQRDELLAALKHALTVANMIAANSESYSGHSLQHVAGDLALDIDT